jgi:hypothetical protein
MLHSNAQKKRESSVLELCDAKVKVSSLLLDFGLWSD